MTSRIALKTLSVILLVIGVLAMTALSSPFVEAEGKSGPPTPTNVPTGGSRDSNERHTVPDVPRSIVSGYVYNYSEAVRAGGVKVILDGGEWRLEAVTDSNGFYRFGGLGQGKSVLRLELPAGARSATPDWPLSFGVGEEIVANLGFFWGNDPPIPVLLSASLSGSTMTVQVENRTVEPATGAHVAIVLPTSWELLPGASTSQGEVSPNDNKVNLNLGEIAAGDVVVARMRLTGKTAAGLDGRTAGEALPATADDGSIQVIFTYDQQITPQRWLLNTDAVMLSLRTVAVSTPAADSVDRGSAMTASTPLPTRRSQVAASAVEEEADGLVSAQSVTSEGVERATEAPAAEKTSTAADVMVEDEPGALPVSGGRQPVNPLAVALPILLVTGLALAGWRSGRART